MLRAATLADAAAAFAVSPSGDSLAVADGHLDDSIWMEDMAAHRVDIASTTIEGNLVFRRCRIDRLTIDHCAADELILFDCEIGRLEIRNGAAIPALILAEGEYRLVRLHGTGESRLDKVSVSARIEINSLRGKLSVNEVSAGEIRIEGQLAGRLRPVDVEIAHCYLNGRLVVSDLICDRLVLADCVVRGRTDINRLTIIAELSVAHVRVEGQVVINGVNSGATILLRHAHLLSGLAATRLALAGHSPAGAAVLEIGDSAIAGDLSATVNSVGARLILDDTSVNGRLCFPAGSVGYTLRGRSNVQDLELPGPAVRTYRQARALAGTFFTETDALAFSIARAACGRQRRLSEEDLFYYLQRQAEAVARGGFRGFCARIVFGRALGWGVRILAPARSLLVGIAATTIGLHVVEVTRHSGRLWDAGLLWRETTLALALWLNVQTGTPSQLQGDGWTVVANCTTGLGLLFTTLLVGIAIRKLVR